MESDRWQGIPEQPTRLKGPCEECATTPADDEEFAEFYRCLDHDRVCCHRCTSRNHLACRKEGVLTNKLPKLEVPFLVDYLLFASRYREMQASWAATAIGATNPLVQKLARLQILSAYMASTEDLAFLLEALRRRLVWPIEKQSGTLIETLLTSNEGKLPEVLGDCTKFDDVSSRFGLDFIARVSIPGVETSRLQTAVARAVFVTAFGTPGEPPNWRPDRWRAYQKTKHGTPFISNPQTVFDIDTMGPGPAVIDWLRREKEPKLVAFNLDGKESSWVDLVQSSGFTQRSLVLCYLCAFHSAEVGRTTGSPILTLLDRPELADFAADLQQVAGSEPDSGTTSTHDVQGVRPD